MKITRFPKLRRLVCGLSQRRNRFYPRLVHVGFEVGKVSLGEIFFRVLRFSPVRIIALTPYSSPSTLCSYQKDERAKPSKAQCYFGNLGPLDKEELFTWSLQAQEVILRVCHSDGSCSITGLSVWGLWWTKWHWDGFFSEYPDFPLSVSFLQSTALIYVSSTLFNLSSLQGRCTPHLTCTNIKILRDNTVSTGKITDLLEELVVSIFRTQAVTLDFDYSPIVTALCSRKLEFLSEPLRET